MLCFEKYKLTLSSVPEDMNILYILQCLVMFLHLERMFRLMLYEKVITQTILVLATCREEQINYIFCYFNYLFPVRNATVKCISTAGFQSIYKIQNLRLQPEEDVKEEDEKFMLKPEPASILPLLEPDRDPVLEPLREP